MVTETSALADELQTHRAAMQIAERLPGNDFLSLGLAFLTGQIKEILITFLFFVTRHKYIIASRLNNSFATLVLIQVCRF